MHSPTPWALPGYEIEYPEGSDRGPAMHKVDLLISHTLQNDNIYLKFNVAPMSCSMN